MIHIRVIEAENIPIYNNQSRKTLISCFSISSYRYYYGSFKSKDKTTHPIWNAEFDADLFRLIELNFTFYGTRILSKDVFLGKVDIDFIKFISKPPGNQIIGGLDCSIRYEFPIICDSPNAFLSLSFSYIPSIYRPIEFNPSTYSKHFIHLWATFSPPITNFETPVEIELLQAFPIEDETSDIKYGLYYNLNKETPFESIGKSSSPRYFLGPTGLTQIHSFSVSRMNGKFTFFILNISNFSGKVTLNFISEQKGKFQHFNNYNYMQPKTPNNEEIGIIKTIEINVQPNMKYCIPFYLFFEYHEFKKNTFEFTEITTAPVLDKNTLNQGKSEIEFHSQIITNIQSVPENEDVNFLRTNVLPSIEKVSLSKILNDFHLNEDCELRVYVGGSKIHMTGNSAYTDFWNQSFVVYDKTTGQRCPEISKLLTSKPISQYASHFTPSFLKTKLKWNSILTLNLNEIGKDKTLVYFVSSSSDLQEAFPSGFFLISSLLNENETLLFRNPIYADVRETFYAICFRLEFCENGWEIIPMRHYFKTRNEMDFVLDSIHANNWILPEILENRKNGNYSTELGNDEFLINDIKLDDI